MSEHEHYFVYAGRVKDEETGEEYEDWRCSSPGCGETERRGEVSSAPA